jgi:putative ABC transport system permease protein
MPALLQDFRYALRTLHRSWALTLVIVASLAIGIGANTAIFSVVNALMLKPLPYPDPDKLAVLWLRSPGINIPQDWPSPGQYIDLTTENRSFEEISISQGRTGTLLGLAEPERVEGLATSSNLFHLLGARPLYGRLLLPEDDVPGGTPVVVLSHGFWTRVFGADPNVIGRSLTLNGVGPGAGDTKNQFIVAGVLPKNFLMNDEVMQTVASTTRMDLFLPLPLGADAVKRRGDENYNLMARLKPGVTMEQAQADVSAIAGRIRDQDQRDKTFTISVVPLQEQVVGNVQRALFVLFGSVTLVLLIACANVANLLLTRATGRQKEMAIRTALGAGWQRVVRQLLIESVLLGVLGGAAGLLIALAALYVVRTINPGNIPRLDVIGIDGAVLAFTFGVSIVTGIVFGLAPAIRVARADLNTGLKHGGRSGRSEGGFGSRWRLRSLLIVAEVAFSLMLLIGAGLLVRSFIQLQRVPPGFNPDHVISMRLGASGRQFANNVDAAEFRRQIGDQIARIPGISARGAVSVLPFTTGVGWGGINVEGWTPQPGQELQVDQRAATPDYFRTMQVPLVRGRYFADADTQPNAQPVVIIDEKFAQRFWPGGDAIGKQLWNDPKRRLTIVGVVGTVKQYGLEIDGRIVVYRPSAGLLGYQVARTTGDPAAMASTIVSAIRSVDPTIPVYDIRTMTERMSGSLARQRFSMIMLTAFAAFALILAAVGVYGVMSYLVSQGTHDIGVRMALGAQRGRILGMIMRQGVEFTGVGVVIGIIGALVLTRVMSSLLFGVRATDMVTFASVPVILAAVSLLACYLPAWRATRVDPVIALRDE